MLLRNRVPRSGHYWDEDCKCHVTPKAPTALQDAQRAVGLVRFHASEWHVDAHKIGGPGFSAGGHLSAAVSTHFRERLYPVVDAADKRAAARILRSPSIRGTCGFDDREVRAESGCSGHSGHAADIPGARRGRRGG